MSTIRVLRASYAWAIGAIIAFTLPLNAGAQAVDAALFDEINFREIGPAVFSGRIVDIELIPGNPSGILAAGASGGLFRSGNNGTTWECIFQDEGTISIGDVAVDPTNADVIWVGTGEANNQRSSYWGDGVYKTTDGGKTWTNVGLPESHHIGRIVIDPTNTDTVYVAALGHLYTFNDERGVYKTTDGGATWKRVLFVDEKTGIVDIVLDRSDPKVLLAAAYQRLRRAWHFDGAGPGSGIYRSADAGETWERLKGGLPDGRIGRIGLTMSPQNTDILYATVSNQNSPPAEDGKATTDLGFSGTPVAGGYRVDAMKDESSAAAQGMRVGDLVTAIGEKDVTDVWTLLETLGALKPGQTVTITFKRGDDVFSIEITIRAGGEDDERDMHGIPVRQVGGEIYRSEDGGTTWKRMNERPVGGAPPYYYGQIRVDPNDHQRIYVLSVPVYASSDGGVTWQGGNVAGSVHVDHHALVVDPDDSNRLLLGNDGGLAISYDRGNTWDHFANLPLAQFYAVAVDMQEPYHVYGGTQDNGTWGGPSTSRSPDGVTNEQWYRVGGGDGFYAQVDPTDSNIVYGESQFGVVYRLDKSTWQSRSIRPPQSVENGPPDRYNWNSPILVSHHNPSIIYFGGNRLFKSFNRGDTWPIVSDDLTTADPAKVAGNVPHCTITTIAESPIDPSLVLVGTDDGLVQMSRDGALSWLNLAGRFPGVPSNWWVSRVVLSRHDVNVAYVAFTGYREDDFRPFLYRTSNGGENWQQIAASLPAEPINSICEDPRNPNVLYIGTEFGAWVSIDCGQKWMKLTQGVPSVPVHDLVVHPREHELVLATHGRGFFIADVKPFAELDNNVLAADAHFFDVRDAVQWNIIRNDGWSGDRRFTGENAERGVALWYWLGSSVEAEKISLVILNAKGEQIAEANVERSRGLHQVRWDYRTQSTNDGDGNTDNNRRGRRGRGGGGGSAGPGSYTAVLKVNDNEYQQEFTIRRDPMLED
ncbi:MAG: VPS10 domain-containing protein [Phycisphaerales bacterium]